MFTGAIAGCQKRNCLGKHFILSRIQNVIGLNRGRAHRNSRRLASGIGMAQSKSTANIPTCRRRSPHDQRRLPRPPAAAASSQRHRRIRRLGSARSRRLCRLAAGERQRVQLAHGFRARRNDLRFKRRLQQQHQCQRQHHTEERCIEAAVGQCA